MPLTKALMMSYRPRLFALTSQDCDALPIIGNVIIGPLGVSTMTPTYLHNLTVNSAIECVACHTGNRLKRVHVYFLI